MSCKKTPWLGVVTNVPVLALMVAEIGHDWGIYSMQSDLPTYFDEVLKFSISKSGLFNALPYACMWCVAMIAAFICDALIARKKCSVGALRKIFTGIGESLPTTMECTRAMFFFLQPASDRECS